MYPVCYESGDLSGAPYFNTHTHTFTLVTAKTAKTRSKRKKCGQRELLGTCRASLDVFHSVRRVEMACSPIPDTIVHVRHCITTFHRGNPGPMSCLPPPPLSKLRKSTELIRSLRLL